ncbi:hypothetical protein P9209_28480 [Prescottella defluvii]|nr:hypothetical protein P9209_28480 [Prescottella defluvii]
MHAAVDVLHDIPGHRVEHVLVYGRPHVDHVGDRHRDVDAVRRVEGFGGPATDQAGDAGGVTHTEDDTHSGGLGGFVQIGGRYELLGDVELVAHVDIVDPALDRGTDDRHTEPVERADGVEHDVGAGDHRLDAGRIGRVEPLGLASELLSDRGGLVEVEVGDDEFVVASGEREDPCHGAGDGSGAEDDKFHG